MKKRLLALALVLLMVLSLAACGSQPAPAPSPSQDVEPDVEDTSPEPDQQQPPETQGDTKTMEYFADKLADGQYTMETKMDFGGMTTTTLTAYDGDNVYSETDMDGTKTTFIIKDGYQYILDPTAKTCMKIPSVSTEEMTEYFGDSVDNYLVATSSGNIDIDGKSYSYEEFSIEGLTFKYCFDGNDLKYIITDMGDQSITMEVLRLEKGVDKSLFEIPADYTVTEY